MNISSTPFIRNDYWPDYNDINQLNQRINEVENELDITNMRLSTNIENVSNNLNSYANNQANTTIANNIIVNNINANYAIGKFVNFGNANFDNAYVENLTVNKPVFDITLNTPHIENVTSLGGNIYDANLFNINIAGGNVAFNSLSADDFTAVNATISNVNILDGNINLNKATIDEAILNKANISTVNILDGNAVLNKVNISDLNASNAAISNLFVNVQPEPVQSSAVLGYDSQGRVIPIEATYDVGFPENANYLFTDTHGTAFAGVAATEVSAVDNLITAQAVQNGFNDINANVQNGFNDINANVQNGFNDIDILLKALIGPSICDAKYYTINSGSTNNAGLDKTFTYIAFTTPADTTGYNVSLDSKNVVYAKVVGDTLTYSSDLIVTNGFMNRVFNSNMASTFANCSNFNQNILIPNSVTSMASTFANCSNFNQNILIPNSVTSMAATFRNCHSLNQNILIPNSVTDIIALFGLYDDEDEVLYAWSESLNQNILIPNSVIDMNSAFAGCTNLNQNILLPNNVSNITTTFACCTNLNQNILIPQNVKHTVLTFCDCENLNQNIYLYSDKVSNLYGMFQDCALLSDKYIHIRRSIPMDTSNVIYNSLVNNYTGINWTGRLLNDLEEPTQWPPV